MGVTCLARNNSVLVARLRSSVAQQNMESSCGQAQESLHHQNKKVEQESGSAAEPCVPFHLFVLMDLL